MRLQSAAVLITSLVARRELSTRRSGIQLWLWPNVVSLDAPFVAVLWQLLLAQGLRVRLHGWEPGVLALAVWCVYMSDQILDALRPATGEWEPERKKFYRTHFRVVWKVGLGLVLLAVPLAFELLRRSTFLAGLVLTIPVVFYFGLVHLAPARWRGHWPREAVVAALFTLGTFLGVWIAGGRNGARFAGPAILFALLCWVNICAIETWEWQRSAGGGVGMPSKSARWAAKYLRALACGIAALAVLMGAQASAPVSFAATAFASGVALFALAGSQPRLTPNLSRVAADAALCTPLLTLAFYWAR